jgi:hypothetical protein
MNTKEYNVVIENKAENHKFIQAAKKYAVVESMKESLRKVDMAYKELKRSRKQKNQK